MSGNPEHLRTRNLWTNDFLHHAAVCYYVLDYLRYGHPDNPEFILTLKNTYNDESIRDLELAKQQVRDILVRWMPKVMECSGLTSCTMVCVPRAKKLSTYTDKQLYLLAGVSEAARLLRGYNVTDGTSAIVRVADTKTTHLKDSTPRITASGDREVNTGDSPYPGITEATCRINTTHIRGKNVLLVDDIYTGGVNIDEDCIQALYDAGAANVVLFTLSCTVPREEHF